jgi:hypothetical protein
MTARPPVCDGHQDVIGPGVQYATISTPGEPDKHLCHECARLVWRCLPDLVRHRAAIAAELAAQVPSVRHRALSMQLPDGIRRRR